MSGGPQTRPRTAAVVGGAAGALAAASLLAAPLIQSFEGYRNVGYLDPSSIPTNCWGHVGGVVVGRRYSDEECKALFTADFRRHATPVVRCITGDVTPGTLGAMISFSYNAGPGVVCGKFAPLINAGNSRAACAKLSLYILSRDRRDGKLKPLAGLVRRRAAERALCERDL